MATISLGPFSRTASNDLPEDLSAGRAILLFGLPPGGVCRAAAVARSAVSSYLTVSPLPSPVARPSGGLFSVALSLFSRTVGVAHHPALGSPDFPPAADAAGGRPGTKRGGLYWPDRPSQGPGPNGRGRAACRSGASGDENSALALPATRRGIPSGNLVSRSPLAGPTPRSAPRVCPCLFAVSSLQHSVSHWPKASPGPRSRARRRSPHRRRLPHCPPAYNTRTPSPIEPKHRPNPCRSRTRCSWSAPDSSASR